MWQAWHLPTSRCAIPCACHAKRRFNVQKWREHVVFCHLPKVLRRWCALYILTSKCASPTTVCTFSTSKLPRVFRTWCLLYILKSKFASRLQPRIAPVCTGAGRLWCRARSNSTGFRRRFRKRFQEALVQSQVRFNGFRRRFWRRPGRL